MTTLREAYDMVDRFLRNNLYDDDYANYAEALELLSSEPPQRKPLTDDELWDLWDRHHAGTPSYDRPAYQPALLRDVIAAYERKNGITGERT